VCECASEQSRNGGFEQQEVSDRAMNELQSCLDLKSSLKSSHLYAPYIWPVVSACAMLMSLSDDDAMVTEMLSGSFFTLNHVVCMPC
jgi:hypothetical protein